MKWKTSDEVIEKIKKIHSSDTEQLRVIFSSEKRILVEAPAGYGKTKTMISKIAYLIALNKIPNPKKILALTFSVNAAYKIKKEVAENLPVILSNLRTSPNFFKDKIFTTNYHGFCRRILRLYGYLLHRSLANIEYLKTIDDSKVDNLINLNIGLKTEEAIEIVKYSDAIRHINEEYLNSNRVYYIEKIKSYFLPNGYITFNAIPLLTIELFKRYPNILEFYRTLFPIIIVDEFQDTNILSWTLLQFLIGDNTEIILMGDPLQRIYGFIGAIPNLMTEAKEKYKLHVIKLKTNYRFRDNPNLLLLDNNIRKIAANPRYPKIENDTTLTVHRFSNQKEEAEGILSICEKILKNEPSCKIAILVKQRSKNTDEILKSLRKKESTFFYALYSDEDEEYIEFHKKSLIEFLKIVSSSDNKINKAIIHRFLRKVRNILKDENTETHNSLLVLLDTFLNKVLTEFRFLPTEEKIELIKDILESKSLKQYLGYVDSPIVISTVHGAKGLEWDYVILPDMEQYSFPNWNGLCGTCPFKINCNINWKSSNVTSEFERKFYEELSVFYVAVTRAKKNVIFTLSKKRIDYKGENKPTNMSCFLKLKGLKLKIIENNSTNQAN